MVRFGPLLAALWALLAPLQALAQEPIFNSRNGTAIEGYDVVAYFTAGAPQPGKPEHAVIWKGAVWQFVSPEHREMFEANPRAYAPQYGGYCAFGVSQGIILHTDPDVWQIRGGKLYLIHNPSVWVQWVEDVPGNIARANANWPRVLAAR